MNTRSSPLIPRWILWGLIGAILLIPGTAFADIQVQGKSNGSAFYWSGSNQGTDVWDLHFTPNSFGIQSSDLPLNLGSFFLSCWYCTGNGEDFSAYDFKLKLTFSVPA